MKKLAFLLVTVTLFGPCFAQDSNKTQDGTKNLTIIGTIKTFDEFVTYATPKTYIQIVPYLSDNIIWTIYEFQNGTSHAFFRSDLAKLSVPKQAAFRFNLPTITPGRYFFTAQ